MYTPKINAPIGTLTDAVKAQIEGDSARYALKQNKNRYQFSHVVRVMTAWLATIGNAIISEMREPVIKAQVKAGMSLADAQEYARTKATDADNKLLTQAAQGCEPVDVLRGIHANELRFTRFADAKLDALKRGLKTATSFSGVVLDADLADSISYLSDLLTQADNSTVTFAELTSEPTPIPADVFITKNEKTPVAIDA